MSAPASESKARTLDVTIMGRSYKVSCAEDEREDLLQAVAYLDQKMNEIKDSGRVGQPERIAVMAALNIAHELLSTKVTGNFDFAHLKRRIDSMQSILDEVLQPQDRLF
jgi:cell division protein ZapA